MALVNKIRKSKVIKTCKDFAEGFLTQLLNYYFIYFKHIIMVYGVDEKMGKLGATGTTDDFIKFFWSKFVDFYFTILYYIYFSKKNKFLRLRLLVLTPN